MTEISYDKLPDEVRKNFTEDEFDTLKKLQGYLNDSVEYIDKIIEGDDIDGNLQYIIHDWIGDRGKEYNRNLIIISALNRLVDAKQRQKREVENS